MFPIQKSSLFKRRTCTIPNVKDAIFKECNFQRRGKKTKVAVSPKIYAQLWKNVMERERDKASNT